MDNESPSIPELANMTPEEALAMSGSPSALHAWMERMNLQTLPRGFFGALAKLAFDAEVARADAAAAASIAARSSRANRRRADLDRLGLVFDDCRDRLPLRLRQVYELCIDQGRPIAAAAAALGIAPTTVRTHLKRLREIARRNPDFRPQPRSATDALATLGYTR